MRLLLVLLLLTDVASLLPLATHRTPVQIARVCARMGWAEAKKKREEEDRKKFTEMQELRERESVKREAAAKVERELQEEKRQKERERVQNFQDNVDFDRPGGVLRGPPSALTKADFENSQVMRSPVIDSEAALQDATARAGTLESQDAAISLLRKVLSEADAARVPAQSQQRKAAAALLSAFEQAATQAEAATAKDPMQAAMNAIFSDEYMVPGFEDDLA